MNLRLNNLTAFNSGGFMPSISTGLPYYITADIGNDDCTPFKFTNSSPEACNYVSYFYDACEGGGYFPWTQYIVCEENPHLHILLIIISIIFLFFLFIMMTTIADDFFCPSISTIVDHLKISQNIAGITLMAFGNGANGIFSIIASVLNTNHPKAGLAMGDLLGGGAFVTTIVFSTIIISHPFKFAKFSTLRNLTFYLIGIGWMAFMMLYDKKLYFWEPAAFLVLYFLYVLTVVFEQYFLKFFKNSENEKPPQISLSNLSSSSDLNANIAVSDATFQPLKRSFSLYVEKPKKHRRQTSTSIVSRCNVSIKPTKIVPYIVDSFDVIKEVEDIPDVIVAIPTHQAPQIAPITTTRIIKDLISALNPIDEDFHSSTWYSKILQILKCPIIVILKLTIPQAFVWCKTLLLIQCLTMPITVIFALKLLNINIIRGDPGLWVYCFIPSLIMLLFVLFFMSYNVEPAYYKNLSGYFGFIISVSWIYLMSTEIVNVMLMLSIISKMSQEILGLTVMAWCNNAGDFIADTAVAKQGFPQMGASAAIGAPFFTMLIGFGTAFFIATLQGKHVNISMDSINGLLVIMVASSLTLTLIMLLINKFYAKRIHGFLLIALYFGLLIIVILTDLKVIKF